MDKAKSTSELKIELMETEDLKGFFDRNRGNFRGEHVADVLCRIFAEKGLSKSELARKAGISEVYLHQVFSGRRNPSRDRLLCICFGLELSLEETQSLLKECGYARLYPRRRKDAVIIHGLARGLGVDEVNEEIFRIHEDTLC